mgnify:CR=1 FL=1
MLIDSIFVDTSAWVALADSDDINHRKAVAVYPTLLKKHRSLFTTNLIVAKTYILILRTMGHEAAIKFFESINASSRIIRICSTEDIEREAERILKKYSDQDFSYTDAVSFVVMNKQRIKKAFCFDTHFETMRFIKIP